MAETTTPAPLPASDSSWFEKLLTAGAGVYSGYTNGQVANANNKAAAKVAQAAAANSQTQQSSVVKYALIAVGFIVTVGLVIFLVKKK